MPDQSCCYLHVFISCLTLLNALCFNEDMQRALLQENTRLLFWGLQTSPCMEWHKVPAWMDSWDLHHGKQQQEAPKTGRNTYSSPWHSTWFSFWFSTSAKWSLELQRGMDAYVYRCPGSTSVSSIAGHWARGAKMVVKQDFWSHSTTSSPSRCVDVCQSGRNGKKQRHFKVKTARTNLTCHAMMVLAP